MASAKLNGADYLLLLLYLNDKQPILGAIRLTKMMFLFEKEVAPILKSKGCDFNNLPEFIAYNFGPFSKDLYEQVELFKGIEFIKVMDLKAKDEMVEVDDWQEMPFADELTNTGYRLNDDGKYYKYQLLNTGAKYVEEKIIPGLSNEQIEIIKQFKAKITSLYPKQILKYVYTKYPEFTTKSLIVKEVLDDE